MEAVTNLLLILCLDYSEEIAALMTKSPLSRNMAVKWKLKTVVSKNYGKQLFPRNAYRPQVSFAMDLMRISV